MNIDIQSVLDEIKKLLLNSISNNSPKVKKVVLGYVADAETRLSNLAEGALSGELSYQFVVERLQEETINVRDQLISVGEIIGANLDELAKAVVAIFENALKNAITK